jgi:SAM-dependent methyltransferase
MKKILFKKLPLPTKPSILDVGCFNGKQNAWMRKFDYEGVDLLFKDSHIIQKDALHFFNGNKKKFDLILFEFSLQQIKKFKAVILMAKHALKPGGFLYIQSFNEYDPYVAFFSQRQYFEMTSNMRITFWRTDESRDNRDRRRNVTELLLQKPDDR